MKGSASMERMRVASLRGISESAWFTEARTESGVRGRPNESNVSRFSWRDGLIEAYLDKRSETSEGGACGARRKYCRRRGKVAVGVALEVALFAVRAESLRVE